MSISVLRSARLFLSVMAVTVFSAMVLVGCSGKDDDDDKDGTTPTGTSLVCAAGEGWVTTIDDIGRDENGDPIDTTALKIAVILKGDNSLVLAAYFDIDDEWAVMYGWFDIGNGTWSTSGNNLTITINFTATYPPRTSSETGTYTISGNTATFKIQGELRTCTKTKDITVQQVPDDPDPSFCWDEKGNTIECPADM